MIKIRTVGNKNFLVLATKKKIPYINISIEIDHAGLLNEYPSSKPQFCIKKIFKKKCFKSVLDKKLFSINKKEIKRISNNVKKCSGYNLENLKIKNFLKFICPLFIFFK